MKQVSLRFPLLQEKNMRCTSYSTAQSYNLKGLIQSLGFAESAQVYSDAAYMPYQGGSVFCFSYGCAIFWGLETEQESAFLKLLKPFEDNAYSPNFDGFEYNFGSKYNVKNDIITLNKSKPHTLQMLAVSYGLSQSSKLAVFEDRIYQTIEETRHIPRELASRGKISLSKREIGKKIGELFIERNSVNLHTDILDTPAFFWDHSEFEPLYNMTRADLDVNARTKVLNTRLDIVRELFEVMGDELNYRHAAMLEWIIIILICIEVVFTGLTHVFKII
jgi:uncharacterized Rmd1/YagE family protein